MPRANPDGENPPRDPRRKNPLSIDVQGANQRFTSPLLPLAAVLVLVLPSVVGTAGMGPGSPVSDPLRVGGSARYVVDGPASRQDYAAALSLDELGTCRDGLDRLHACLNATLALTVAGVPHDPDVVGISWEHGEVIQLGSWNLTDGRADSESFVSSGPRWYASPVAVSHPFWPSEFMDAYRVLLVGALTLPARYLSSGDGSLTLAGTPGSMVGTVHHDGGIEVEAVFRHESPLATTSFRYALTIGQEGGFPREVTLSQVEPEPRVVAVATRVDHASGNGRAVRFSEPVPYPTTDRRVGYAFLPWSSQPPETSSEFLFPIAEATRYTGLADAPSVLRALPAPRYLTWAAYREAPGRPGHGALYEVDVEARVGRWFLWEPAPGTYFEPQLRESSAPWVVTREAPRGLTGAAVDTVAPMSPELMFASDRWKPHRQLLAAESLGLGDAVRIARAAAPHREDAFEAIWRVTDTAAEVGTAWESTITLLCGTSLHASSYFAVVIGASTGQLLKRLSGGHDQCKVQL